MILDIKQLTKYYGKRKALNAISFDIEKGTFAALLGQNGAGKTTLFQLLTGLFVPDSGSIAIDGNDITKSAVKALAGIGVVFQQITLDMDLSIKANLKLHTRLHGINDKVANYRIQKELERLELFDRLNEPVRSLSGGNKRKVELARSLLHEPHILFMDEASVGLDPAARQSLVDYVYELKDTRKVSILWATHLVDEVNNADKLIVLHQGHLLMSGEPQELLNRTNENNLSDAFLNLTSLFINEGAKAS